ncbi:MAG: hypothetical protein AAF766_13010 [Cyanobacteria bacterium P01_D01_bin.14]
MKFGALRPLFLLVLGAHAALLAIPISGASDELVPAPDPEGDTITVTRIPPQNDEAAGAKAAGQPSAGQRATQPQPTATTAAKPATTTQAARPAANRTAAPQNGRTTARRSNSTTPGTSSSNQDRQGSDSSTDGPTVTPPENNAQGGLSPLPDRQPATPPSQRTSDDDTTETSLIAALQAGARQGNVQALTALMAAFNDALTFNNIQTSVEDEVEETNKWLGQLQAETGNANLTEQVLETALKIPYPLEETTGFEEDEWAYDRDFVGCLSQEPNPATVGLYFDQRGELVDDPVLLRSSGYGFLDAEALARAENFAGLPETRAGRAFTIPVAVEYREQSKLLGETCSQVESMAQTDTE